MSWPLHTLDSHKRGHTQFHRVAGKLGGEGTHRTSTSICDQATSRNRRSFRVLNPLAYSLYRGPRRLRVVLRSHEFIIGIKLTGMTETAETVHKPSSITLRFMAAPTDVIHAGAQGVSGGRVLEWIDKAAYACAVQWSSTYCVTAYVGHIHFTRPIPSGHIVEVRSRIAMTGRSSMHIVNEVLSADPREGVFTRACDCLVIFVAKDTETGKSKAVPTYVPQTEEEKRVEQAAKSRLDLRKNIEDEMLKQSYEGESKAPRIIHRFMAKPTDINWGGKVHGGTAMEWIDAAGTSCTMEWSGEQTVAVYAGGIRFYRPIAIGDLIEVDARLTRTGERSMSVTTHVRSGDPRGGRESLETAIHATFTYVATGIDGEPLQARTFVPETEADKALWDHAEVLKGLREEFHPIPLVTPTPARQTTD